MLSTGPGSTLQNTGSRSFRSPGGSFRAQGGGPLNASSPLNRSAPVEEDTSRGAWEQVAPTAMGGRPPKDRRKLPPATPGEEALWRDSYQWDNPFSLVSPSAKPCPGIASWGFWPGMESGRVGEWCECPDLALMRNFLDRVRAPYDDIQNGNDNDMAIRVFDVLDDQFDLFAPLSTGAPRRPVKRHPDDEREIADLYERQEELEAKIEQLEKDLRTCISRRDVQKMWDVARFIQNKNSELCVDVERTLCASTLFDDIREKILRACTEAQYKLQALENVREHLRETLQGYRSRLALTGGAAAVCVAVARDALFPFGLEAFLRPVPQMTERMQSFFEEAAEQCGVAESTIGDLRQLPLGDDPFAPTDLRHCKVTLAIARLSSACVEIARTIRSLEAQVRNLESDLAAEQKRRKAAEGAAQEMTGKLNAQEKDAEEQKAKLVAKLAAEAEERMKNAGRKLDERKREDESAMALVGRIEDFLKKQSRAAEAQEVCNRLYELDRLYGKARKEQRQAVQDTSAKFGTMVQRHTQAQVGSKQADGKPRANPGGARSAIESMLTRERERHAKLEAKIQDIKSKRTQQLEAVIAMQGLDAGSGPTQAVVMGTIGQTRRGNFGIQGGGAEGLGITATAPPQAIGAVLSAVSKLKRYVHRQAEDAPGSPTSTAKDAIFRFMAGLKKMDSGPPGAPATLPVDTGPSAVPAGGKLQALQGPSAHSASSQSLKKASAFVSAVNKVRDKETDTEPAAETDKQGPRKSKMMGFAAAANDGQPRVLQSFGQTVLALRATEEGSVAEPTPTEELPAVTGVAERRRVSQAALGAGQRGREGTRASAVSAILGFGGPMRASTPKPSQRAAATPPPFGSSLAAIRAGARGPMATAQPPAGDPGAKQTSTDVPSGLAVFSAQKR